ncbi:MAG: 30S ribosomal protein S4e, partial [Candidatus Altiarchaeota archaeon]
PKIKKQYRVIPTPKGVRLKEIDSKQSQIKICKIKGKTKVKTGATQLNLHDGTNLIVQEDKFKVNDSLLINLPDRKIQKSFQLKKGNFGLVVSGRHSGKTGPIKEVIQGTPTRQSLTEIGENLQTMTKYIFVLGEKEAEITL